MPRESSHYQPLVHRTALAVACLSLLPIGVGALVTTMKAGMAFRDWPNSDGQFMLTYPWFADFVRGAMDKFVEHGHRLAGMLIGVATIAMAVVVGRREPRGWVRGLAIGVLLGVIVQGLLGGGRVLANDPRMAMAHGNFAAVVFCVMAALAVVTSRRWIESSKEPNEDTTRPSILKPLAVITAFAIYGQYILGGRQRHLHDMLHEHLGGAVLTALLVIATTIVAHRRRVRWLSSAGWMMFAVLMLQVTLGAGAWATKFGFQTTGYVAVHGSPMQLFVRSSHTVVGMLLMMTSIVLVLRIFRFESQARETATALLPASPLTDALGVSGGAQ